MSTTATRASMDYLLRRVYYKKMITQWNANRILLQTIPRKNTERYAQGELISVPLDVEGSEGFQFSDDLMLPPGSLPGGKRAHFTYRGITDRIKVLADVIDDTAISEASEREILDLQIDAVSKSGGVDMNFMLYGDGSGKMATPATATSATVLTVDDTRGLRNNQRVDILVVADGTTGGGVKGVRISVEHKTKTITLRDAAMADYSAVNAAPTSYAVYRSGSRNKALLGLDAWIATGNPPGENLGGIDRTLAANEFYRANVNDQGQTLTALSFSTMQAMIDDCENNGPGMTPDLAVCHPKVHARLIAYLDKRRRTNSDTMKLKGWATAVMFGELPIVKDKHCKPDTMYFLNLPLMRIWQPNEGKWLDKDGAILSRMENQAAYQAGWYRRLQVVMLAPSAFGKITYIKDEAISDS